MVLRALPDTSTGPRGGQSRQVVVIAALLLALALPVRGREGWCVGVDCEKTCDNTHLEFRPQECDNCCAHMSNEDGKKDGEPNERMEAMEAAIHELRVMVGVILALLVVLLLLAVVVLIFRHSSTKALKDALPVFFRSKDEGRASIEKRPPPPNKVPAENRNSTVVRIADYQNNHSPLTKRMRHNGQAVHEDSVADHSFPPSVDVPRPRQPSESTCPDDSADLPHSHQHAYDNLALSTSTLHDTTTSSTSTLGPAVSTNTLDTTLPSVSPLQHPA